MRPACALETDPSQDAEKSHCRGPPYGAVRASWTQTLGAKVLESRLPPPTILQAGNLRAQTHDCITWGHTTGRWQHKVGPGSSGQSVLLHASYFSVLGCLMLLQTLLEFIHLFIQESHCTTILWDPKAPQQANCRLCPSLSAPLRCSWWSMLRRPCFGLFRVSF